MTDRSADATPEPSGRRTSGLLRARFGPLEVLAVVLPLLTVAALALVRPVDESRGLFPPTEVPLARTTLMCPSILSPVLGGGVSLSNADGVSGELAVRVPGDDVLRLDGTTRIAPKTAYAVQAEGDVAAALVGTRSGDGAAVRCGSPQSEQWFTGVAAAAEHYSTLELVNPDGGPAVADVSILGPDGPLDVPALRGVTVPGGQTLRFDLSEVVPSREELVMQVLVSRGRLGVQVADRIDEVGDGVRSRDWVPAQSRPDTSAYLLGLGGKSGERNLVLANPGDSEARVRLEVITKESTFVPADFDEIRVPPRSSSTVDLTELLGEQATRGALGLHLAATAPVTAGLRTVADGDLTHTVAADQLTTRTALALPAGRARLVLGGADSVGVATYVVFDDEGKELVRERVDVTPGVGLRIKLPGDGWALGLEVDRTGVFGVVEFGPPGLAVLPLTELLGTARVADVRPALR